MSLRPLIALCCFLMGITPFTMAQPTSINFTSLTSKNGLSSNTINAILKDRYGWMWFATEDGLNRFDGNRFTVYRHKENDPTSLPVSDITCLYEDKAGNVWIGTNGGSLNLYDRKRDAFMNVSTYEGAGVLRSGTILAICSDHSGKLWVAGFGRLLIIDPVTKKRSPLPASFEKNRLLSDKQVTSLFEDSRRLLWIGTSNGLYNYNPNNQHITTYLHADADSNSVVSNSIKTIAEDHKGNVWVGTTGGLSMLMPGRRSFRNFRHEAQNEKSISSNIIYAIAADTNHHLWLGTEEGLNILDIMRGEVLRIAPDKRNHYSLNRKSVRSLFLDQQGIYWVGTFQGGINKYDKNLYLFQLKQSNVFDEHGLQSSVVTSFAAGDKQQVYIGTDGGGLHVYNRNTGLFSQIQLSCVAKSIARSLAVLALERDHKGRLWIGTFSNGLFLYDPVTKKCRSFKQGAGTDSILSNDIFCIKEDSKGKIWIGTNGEGVTVYDPNSSRFHTYSNKPNSATNHFLQLNGYIRAIEEDEKGKIWIATHGSGMAMLNPETHQYKLYNQTNSKLPANVVLSLLKDSHQIIWVGTAGGGLSVLNKQNGQFISYSEKDGLPNAIVYKIVEDHNGQLWVSTNAGISNFNTNTKRFTNYTHDNGVQNNNFVLGSGIRLQDGEIFFGGLDGFNFFNPRMLQPNNLLPPVVLTDLKVANQSVLPSDNGPIQEQIAIASTIQLDYKQSFSLSFAALDYTAAQQNTYAYKLEGFDKDWNYVAASKTASYTNIDPGDYVFQVRVRNNNGVWNPKAASITIHIQPPFWRTTYAYIFYGALIIGLLFFSRYTTIQRLRKKFAAEQEKRGVQQLIEGQRKEAEVARELDQLKIKFLTNLSHEFRTPISLIMGPVDNLLLRGYDENTVGQLSMVRRNAKRLLNLVNQLLDFRKMEENELRLHPSEGEVISFIKEVFDSFRDLADRKKINYIFSTQVQRLPVLFDHDKLERILFNLLSNAFKFTPAEGTIQLETGIQVTSVDDPAAALFIHVSDTGIGIPPNKKEKIFERFFQINSSAVLNQGTGIGLSITHEFVKMQGGTITVESEQGAGTVFRIQIPFTKVTMPVVHQEATPYLREKETVNVNGNIKNGTGWEFVNERIDMPVILLVEDDDDFRFYLKDNLRHDYKVMEACNGKDAWQKILTHHPQLVVSDVTMPVVDGLQLIHKIKSDKRTNHIPVVLLTALTAAEEQLKGLATGANDYMTKPFNFEILHAKIKNLLLLNHSLKTTYTKQIQVQVPAGDIESQDAALMKAIRLYIEEHLIDPELSVHHLSKHVGMSRSSLYSKMLDLTGQTPIEYIRSVKLEKAAILLEKSELNVAQVAYATGFATPNYFAKTFKAKFNMVPSEYVHLKRRKPAGDQ